MSVKYVKNILSEKERDEIWDILCQCDDEFYPRLSARESSSQKDLCLGVKPASIKPVSYFKEMIQQEFILAYEEHEVIGFMTFKKNYNCDALHDFVDSLYITTVCVRNEFRGLGILESLYCEMENNVTRICDCNKISTRTWSLNQAQIHVLDKRAYNQIKVLKDDRGPSIDTVYYGKQICKEI